MISNNFYLLCIKIKGNDLFYTSHRLLGRGSFGYQMFGAGKHRTEYLTKDFLALLVNEDEKRKRKSVERLNLCLDINDSKVFSSLKNIYLPGLHAYENFSHMSSSYNFFF